MHCTHLKGREDALGCRLHFFRKSRELSSIHKNNHRPRIFNRPASFFMRLTRTIGKAEKDCLSNTRQPHCFFSSRGRRDDHRPFQAMMRSAYCGEAAHRQSFSSRAWHLAAARVAPSRHGALQSLGLPVVSLVSVRT